MSSINLSVPDDIREDRKPAAQEDLEGLLLQGLDSGATEPWTATDVEEIRAVVRERLQKRCGTDGTTQKD